MFEQQRVKPDFGPFRSFALWGGIAGAAAWAITEPFASTAVRDGARLGQDTFTYGSLFGWVLTSVLGALVAGGLTYAVSIRRTTQAFAILAALFAAVLGGAFMCAIDNGLDIFFIHALQTSTHPRLIRFIESPAYGVLDSLAVALAVGIAAQPTPRRFSRALLAGLLGGIAVYLARRALAPMSAIFALMHGIHNLRSWYPFDPSRLVQHVALGVVMGLVLALSDRLLGRATLRLHLGRNEGRDFILYAGMNRIGSIPGLEVSIFEDHAVAPLHAVVTYERGCYVIRKASQHPVYVNGALVEAARLNLGDSIQVGESILTFASKGGGNQVAGYRVPAPTVDVETPRPVHAQGAGWMLVDLVGGTEFPLREGVFSIGRDPSNSLCLSSDSRVSRSHVEFKNLSGQVSVRDVGSTNGTMLNGARLAIETSLRDGDQIEIGTATFVLREK